MPISKTEAAIYSEFHDIFRKERAAYRKPKLIRKTFDDNDDLKSRLDRFCSSSGIPQTSVFDTIKLLLEAEVFASPIKAKLRFPHIFQLSAGQLKEKEKWESEAAMSEAGAIAQSLQGNKIDGFDPPEPEEQQTAAAKRKKSVEKTSKPQISVFAPPSSEAAHPLETSISSLSPTATAHTPAAPQKEADAAVCVEEATTDTVEAKLPNLFPIYLPYPVQHKLTVEAQRLLETVCYDFVKKWLPDKTATEQFANPENAELPMWARLIKKKLKELPAKSHDKSALESETLAKVGGVIENLRHTAVHRLKTHSKGLEDMLEKAVMFAAFLKDERAETLRRILNKAMELSSALESEKILLHNRLRQELEAIEEARQVLKRKEELALKRIVQDDRIAREAITFELTDLNISSPLENQPLDANSIALTDSKAVQTEHTGHVSEVNHDKKTSPIPEERMSSESDSTGLEDPARQAPVAEKTTEVGPSPLKYTLEELEALFGINPQNKKNSAPAVITTDELPPVKPVPLAELTKEGNVPTPCVDGTSQEAILLDEAPPEYGVDVRDASSTGMEQIGDTMNAIDD
ncbi:hypothetical protein Dda_1007 [Drechslerella dactyloides]|uniref:Uncharacterized protein n=1 Tax=Drechslerella dactyloides TaxID=74499 RepID=A0AAD6J5J3_DREDA|nr:hypothetical protein Dda_1007 [Drechslerella dactyloides]